VLGRSCICELLGCRQSSGPNNAGIHDAVHQRRLSCSILVGANSVQGNFTNCCPSAQLPHHLQVEELRGDIRRREWEDGAKKALGGKSSLAALQETLADAPTMAAADSPLLTALRCLSPTQGCILLRDCVREPVQMARLRGAPVGPPHSTGIHLPARQHLPTVCAGRGLRRRKSGTRVLRPCWTRLQRRPRTQRPPPRRPVKPQGQHARFRQRHPAQAVPQQRRRCRQRWRPQMLLRMLLRQLGSLQRQLPPERIAPPSRLPAQAGRRPRQKQTAMQRQAARQTQTCPTPPQPRQQGSRLQPKNSLRRLPSGGSSLSMSWRCVCSLDIE